MESDDEIEILTYTPLKRQKIRGNGAICSTQNSFQGKGKSIDSKKPASKLSRKSRVKNHSQGTAIHSTDKGAKSSFFSQVSNKSKSSFLTFRRPLDVPLKKEQSSQIVNSKSSITPDLLNKSSPEDFEITQVDKCGYDIPDLDFSQLDRKSEPEKKNEKTFSLSSDESESLLKDYKNTYKKSSCSSNVSNGKKRTRLKKSSTVVYSDSPFEEDLEKVSSWLESSNKYITPKEIQVMPHDSYGPVPSCSKNGNDPPSPNSTEAEDEITKTKTCIHLHFHVHSPKKFIQPTIDAFLNSSTAKNRKDNENTSQTKGSNEEDVIKSWKTIMNSLKGAAAKSSELQKNNSQTSGSVKNSFSSDAAGPSRESIRKCPFYKRVEDTSFVVDAFSYGYISGVSAYFLSHFHYDHYTGLTKNFNKSIYCHKITANLIRLKIRVQEQYLRVLPLEEPRLISGVEVTLYDSNHCPGAVMFVFKLSTGKTILHVGDFRAHPDMENISHLWNHTLDLLYLDTTYLDRRYNFFSQEEILEKCASIAKEHLHKETLFVVGSYTIGKEKVFKAIASALDCKIFAANDKQKIFRCLGDKDIMRRLTSNKFEAKVHVVPMSMLNSFKLKKYMDSVQPHFKILVAIKPTGWEHNEYLWEEGLHNVEPKQNGNIYTYGLPYSEHSSFNELGRFVRFADAKRIIPTVNNGSAVARKKMDDILNEWKLEAAETFKKSK